MDKLIKYFETVETSFRKMKVITGMSMGLDIWAGEIVVNLRETDPRLHLIAAVPWPGFSARWNAEWKTRYEKLIKRADLVKHISQTYDPSVFTKRNFWMVEHCTRVIAFYNGSDGGTKEMIEYAKERDIDVVVGGIICSHGREIAVNAHDR